MKAYDPEATCPKCGCILIGTKFESIQGLWGLQEILHRICEGCGFKWNEAPLDADEQQVPPSQETPNDRATPNVR